MPEATDTAEHVEEALRCLEQGDPCSLLPSETKTFFSHARLGRLSRGARGKFCRIAQEWLTLHSARLVLDGDFGPATERAVIEFQEEEDIDPSGIIDRDTATALIAPQMRAIFSSTGVDDVETAIMAAAHGHLKEHPVEVGGDNRGPWVRLYMDGRDGKDFPWCAGFISFVLRQSFAAVGLSMADDLFPGSVSCDVLAQRAKRAGRFVRGSERAPQNMQGPALFLTRRSSTDWTHTGIVVDFQSDVFRTIEGNTNDDGSRNGFEVNSLLRGYGRYDFVRILP